MSLLLEKLKREKKKGEREREREREGKEEEKKGLPYSEKNVYINSLYHVRV
jgi:hypothetical protein